MHHCVLHLGLVVTLLLAPPSPAVAQDIPPADPAEAEKAIAGMFTKAPEEWKSRIAQDETQRLCTLYQNQPPADVAALIAESARESIVYPADGDVIGDWRKGEEIAQSGFGGRFSDKPDAVNGGNCYACHRMRPDELSYGTLGPSLLGYGKAREFDPAEARAAYAKIYNPQAVLPCSHMPRFGYHKFLTQDQIKDLVALLFAEDSPVNR